MSIHWFASIIFLIFACAGIAVLAGNNNAVGIVVFGFCGIIITFIYRK